MNTFLRTLLILLGPVLLLAPARGQTTLYAEHKGKMLLVRGARGTVALVDEDGKRVPRDGTKYILQPAAEFLPIFVSVQNLKVGESYLELAGDASGEINRNFNFKGEFESPFVLKNAFIVLEFDFADKKKSLFIYEIGQLAPRERKKIDLSLPSDRPLKDARFQFHVFTDGIEVFHSAQPFVFREQKLDTMIAARIKPLSEAGVQPFIGPAPEYPAAFAKSKIKGTALVKFRVSTRGTVLDPAVESASEPAFGEAALVAIRQWRFLPRVKAGRPVESEAKLPFVFAPPEKS